MCVCHMWLALVPTVCPFLCPAFTHSCLISCLSPVFGLHSQWAFPQPPAPPLPRLLSYRSVSRLAPRQRLQPYFWLTCLCTFTSARHLPSQRPTQGFTLSSKPHLFSLKLSAWLLCSTSLTDGVEGSTLSTKPCIWPQYGIVDPWSAQVWVWFQNSNDHNLLHFTAADILHHRWMCTVIYFESLLEIN